jgi:hypothetical protein
MEAIANDRVTDPVTAEIRALINGNDTEPEEVHSEVLRPGVQTEDDGEHDTGAREDDTPVSESESSLDDDNAEAESDDTTGEAEPVDLEYLAEKLDVEKADLYELEIPIGDGQKVQLGALKDAYKEYGELGVAKEKQAKAVDQYQRDLMSTRQQLNAMQSVANTPEKQALLREMMGQADGHQNTWEREQQALVYETIPEWKDSDTRAKDRDGIIALGSEYGFSEPEMVYTHDARSLRMLRDMVKLRGRLSEMEKAPERVRAKPNSAGKSTTNKLTKRRLDANLSRAKQATHLHDKVGALSQLINKG